MLEFCWVGYCISPQKNRITHNQMKIFFKTIKEDACFCGLMQALSVLAPAQATIQDHYGLFLFPQLLLTILQSKRLSKGARTFAAIAPRTLNDLPSDFRYASTVIVSKCWRCTSFVKLSEGADIWNCGWRTGWCCNSVGFLPLTF